ncbi:MAG: hypothetical protein AAGL11_04100 [Pseudomonadota bacterium]
MMQKLGIVFASMAVLAACASTDTVTDEAALETDVSAAVVEETAVEEPAADAEPSEVQTAEVAVEEEKPALDPNRKVCKTIEVTGSRIAKKRICRTAAQWEALEDARENDFRRRLRNTSLSN